MPNVAFYEKLASCTKTPFGGDGSRSCPAQKVPVCPKPLQGNMRSRKDRMGERYDGEEEPRWRSEGRRASDRYGDDEVRRRDDPSFHDEQYRGRGSRQVRSWSVGLSEAVGRIAVGNYEAFQQPDSAEWVRSLVPRQPYRSRPRRPRTARVHHARPGRGPGAGSKRRGVK